MEMAGDTAILVYGQQRWLLYMTAGESVGTAGVKGTACWFVEQ